MGWLDVGTRARYQLFSESMLNKRFRCPTIYVVDSFKDTSLNT